MADEFDVGAIVVRLKADFSWLKDGIGKMEKEFGNGFSTVQADAQRASNNLKQSFAGVGQGFNQSFGQSTKQSAAAFDQLGKDIQRTSDRAKRNIAGIADTTKVASDKMTASLNNIAGAFGVAFSAAAIAGFTKSVIDAGGRINDLSERTGISRQLLSGLEAELVKDGVAIDQFAAGIIRAQRSLGDLDDGGKEAAEALAKLGLNAQELAKASPDVFIERFAKALAKVEDQNQRGAIAFRVLGRSASDLIPSIITLADNFDDLRKRGLSDETIKRLDDLGDAMTDLNTKAKLLGSEAVISLAKFFGIIDLAPIEKLGKAATKVDELTDIFAKSSGLSKGLIDSKTIEQLEALKSGNLAPSARRCLAGSHRSTQSTGGISRLTKNQPNAKTYRVHQQRSFK
jgi:hypothetical protein